MSQAGGRGTICPAFEAHEKSGRVQSAEGFKVKVNLLFSRNDTTGTLNTGSSAGATQERHSRYRGNQSLGVGVARIGEDLRRFSCFNDFAFMQDGDSVTDAGDAG